MDKSSTLRILLMSEEYPPETGWGGIARSTHNTAHALARRGHEVHVISAVRSQEERHYEDDDVHVHRLGVLDLFRVGRWRWATVFARYLERAASTYRGSRRLGIEFDVVEYPECGAEGLLFSLSRRWPTVANLRTSWPLLIKYSDDEEGLSDRAAGYLEGLSVRRADAITSPSQALAEWTRAEFRLGDRRISIIPHPAPVHVQPATLGPVDRSRQSRVLCVCRLMYRKNPEVVVRAAKRVCEKIPTAEFIFAGGSALRGSVSYREWLAELAEEHGVAEHIHLAGHQQHHEVEALQRSAAVIVVPSRWENFPNVVQEAMLAARPIVASQAGGIPEMIRDGETGLLVDPEDTDSWAQAIVALLTDRKRAREMGIRAHEDALARFDPQKIAAQREAIYREAIHHHQKQRHTQQHG